MKQQPFYLFLTVLVMTIASCSKDDTEIIKEPTKSSAKQITSFIFKAADNDAITEDVTATINETNKTISATVTNGTDVKSLRPIIVVSDKAVVNESGARDFSSSVEYTITAEDGTKTTYKVTVDIALNSAKQILSFTFTTADNELYGDETITATINEANKTITATVSYSANAGLLTPNIEVSPNASVSPAIPQDFSNPVVYTVTAEDGSTKNYQVTLEISFSDRDALIAIYNANLNNILDWNLNELDLANWNGVQLNNEGRVRVLQLNSKQLTILPSEIRKLSELATLYINNNSLTDLPLLFKELFNLKVLYINSNDFTDVPELVWTLSNLEVLALNDLNLTTLSTGISNLSKLNTLYLDHNKLSTIPTQITGLSNLRILSISDNKITIVPSFISDLKELRNLDLENNELRSISSAIGLLTNLERLSFKGNDLTSIPIEIANLQALTLLDLTLNPDLFAISITICNLANIGTDVRLDNQTTCQ